MEPKEVGAGLRLILEEIRDIKRDMAEDRRRADEHRRRADERFERLWKDSEARFERYAKESEARFERYVRESERREKDLSRALVVIGNVGRQILKKQDEQLKRQDEQTSVLRTIVKRLEVRFNGR